MISDKQNSKSVDENNAESNSDTLYKPKRKTKRDFWEVFGWIGIAAGIVAGYFAEFRSFGIGVCGGIGFFVGLTIGWVFKKVINKFK